MCQSETRAVSPVIMNWTIFCGDMYALLHPDKPATMDDLETIIVCVACSANGLDPHFYQKLLGKAEVHFGLNDYVNKHNYRI